MEYYGIHYDSVIEHHGVKGQKWGVRRYQNPDGTLTEEGKKRLGFSFTNPFAKHKKNLVDKYVSQGYSESAAQAKAKQRIKTELVVGVVGAVAVAAIVRAECALNFRCLARASPSISHQTVLSLHTQTSWRRIGDRLSK